MKNLDFLLIEFNRLLIEDRDSLSDFDIMVIEDCRDLVKVILKTKDETLKKIHLLNLTVKLTAFFSKKETSKT